MGIKNLLGQRFGRLIVIKRAENNKYGQAMWICKCDCGKITKPINGNSLRNGATKSCGCLRKETVKEHNEEAWKDEEYKNKMSEMAKEMNSKIWQSEDFKEKKSQHMKELNKRRWEDEEYRSKRSKQRTELNKEMWNNEEFKKAHSGENHYNYNQNLSDEDREDRRKQQGYNEWAYKVKELADFTCDCCGQRNGTHHSHHLEGYNNNKHLRLDIHNGVCLCERCHKEFHKIYGYGNNTKEQYIEFKENKLKGDDK